MSWLLSAAQHSAAQRSAAQNSAAQPTCRSFSLRSRSLASSRARRSFSASSSASRAASSAEPANQKKNATKSQGEALCFLLGQQGRLICGACRQKQYPSRKKRWLGEVPCSFGERLKGQQAVVSHCPAILDNTEIRSRPVTACTIMGADSLHSLRWRASSSCQCAGSR